jgi:hypothetical protein
MKGNALMTQNHSMIEGGEAARLPLIEPQEPWQPPRRNDPSMISRQPGNRRATASANIVGAAAVALLTSAYTFANAAEASSLMVQEHHACAVVLGLDPMGDLYDTCIRSLDKSLSELAQTQLVESDRSACAQKGLEPGTPAFAVCVIKAEQSPTDAARQGQIVPVR